MTKTSILKVILRFPPTPLPCYADGRINKKKKAKKQIFYKNRFPSLFSIALCCAIVWCYAEIFPKLFHLINRKTFFRFCLPENWFVSWEARKFECSTTSKVINRIEKESRDQTEKKKQERTCIVSRKGGNPQLVLKKKIIAKAWDVRT